MTNSERPVTTPEIATLNTPVGEDTRAVVQSLTDLLAPTAGSATPAEEARCPPRSGRGTRGGVTFCPSGRGALR